MSAMRTKRGLGITVQATNPRHEDVLGAVTVAFEVSAADFHYQTYLTAEEAAELGAALSAAALKGDIEVLSRAALTPYEEPEA